MARMKEPHRERMARAVRRVFLRQRKGRKLIDELDEAALEIAIDAQVALLFLDLAMKLCGTLSEEGAAMYRDACRSRDAALAALKIANPYRPVAN